MPQTLLLADDSVTIQRVIELTFADEDVDVIAVSDGDEAIARLESAPPDIVLADIGMPGRNGYEVATYIKQSSKLSHIPVILLTGAFEPVDQTRATEAGCDGILAKPFEPQLVISRVKELLASRRSAPAPPPAPHTPPPTPADDRPNESVADQLLAEPPAAVAGGPMLDDYFDRLDAAFAGLASSPLGHPASTAARPPEPGVPLDIDWFAPSGLSSAPTAEQWDLPGPPEKDPADRSRTYGSAPAFDASALSANIEPAVSNERPALMETAAIQLSQFMTEALDVVQQPAATESPAPPAPAETVTPATSPRAVASGEPVELPSIADAFAVLLAAEQGGPLPEAAPIWAATAPPNDALVDEVTRQVLARLSDRVVRDTVADLVSQIAERLVREEIERIKGSIR